MEMGTVIMLFVIVLLAAVCGILIMKSVQLANEKERRKMKQNPADGAEKPLN